MTTSTFHQQKEEEQKALNILIQSAKNSDLPEEVKTKFTDMGTNIINAINLQRAFLYHELEKGEFDNTYNHEDDQNTKCTIITSHHHDVVRSTIQNGLISLAKKVFEIDAKSFTGPENNKLTAEQSAEFNMHNDMVSKSLTELSDLIPPEEAPVTEEAIVEEEAPIVEEVAPATEDVPAGEEEKTEELHDGPTQEEAPVIEEPKTEETTTEEHPEL